jgi:hypothetical protein
MESDLERAIALSLKDSKKRKRVDNRTEERRKHDNSTAIVISDDELCTSRFTSKFILDIFTHRASHYVHS